MRGLLAAGPAELAEFYLEFFFLAPGEVVILVLAYRAAQDNGNSVSHS